MSDYTGPGLYEILPRYAPEMSLNVWGAATKEGTQVKLYQRTKSANNTHFEIVAAGGTDAKPEKGDREYHIIAACSGLYLTSAGPKAGYIKTELRKPLDSTIRWKIVHCGNGSYRINNVDGKTQLNVAGGGKTSGTDMIGWQFSDGSENTEFRLMAV
ncbi:uncharacterized protein J4E79_002569 [Alternaria viburni]|uniref:uncharacterized protein n=1 Tax=Alternaria viburni TaxID=566460 RepID=UPI0020C35033|nr:uncharacterized protein J4E79_002569 [Alternaria viburni]KAI4666530.1 hypothetical protein J4E79_002569 [Alternaria viburni]